MTKPTASAKPAPARKAAGKRLASVAGQVLGKKKSVPVGNKFVLRAVSATTVGDFQVFGTLVSPKHVTPKQIAEALDSLD